MMATIFDDLFKLNREMNKFFHSTTRGAGYYWPETNVYNGAEEYVLTAKVPGINKENIAVSIKDNTLTISGTKKKEEGEDINYHLNERRFGDFERNFMLNDKVDVENIKAEVNSGLLVVRVPKSPESKPLNIAIN